MDRYIDADALLKHLNDYALQESSSPFSEKAFYAIQDCMKAVIEQPTADVAPIVHGEWIFKNDGAYGSKRAYCSACGKRSGIGGIKSNQEKPYCPNCGAKMDGKITE